MFRFALSCTLLAFSASIFAAGNTKTFCEHPTDWQASKQAFEKTDKLLAAGYRITKEFDRAHTVDYVGTGLRVIRGERGIFVGDPIPNSPAGKMEFFVKDVKYYVLAVDGVSVDGKNIDEIRARIIGSGKAGSGVVLTLKPGGERTYERYLVRGSVKFVRQLACITLAPPQKK